MGIWTVSSFRDVKISKYIAHYLLDITQFQVTAIFQKNIKLNNRRHFAMLLIGYNMIKPNNEMHCQITSAG